MRARQNQLEREVCASGFLGVEESGETFRQPLGRIVIALVEPIDHTQDQFTMDEKIDENGPKRLTVRQMLIEPLVLVEVGE